MNVKKLAVIYFIIAIIFAFYGNWWGDDAYRGFAYNLGKSIVWPAIVFPSLGKILGGVVLLGVLGLVLASKR